MKMVSILCAAVALLAVAPAPQAASTLLGKWASSFEWEGEQVHIQYEFRTVQGKLLCYSVQLADANGDALQDNTLVMTNIEFANGSGTATFTIKDEGETYEADATLKLTNSNTLQVDYSYYWYSDSETWKRIQ